MNASGTQPGTKDQVFVGHYCRHACELLYKVLQGKENREELMKELTERIGGYWKLWMKGEMSQEVFFEQVAQFINASCVEARDIDVEREFRAWLPTNASHADRLRELRQEAEASGLATDDQWHRQLLAQIDTRLREGASDEELREGLTRLAQGWELLGRRNVTTGSV